MQLNPLRLDKETIAILDFNQLRDIVGGGLNAEGNSAACGSGGSACKGGSTSCGSGGSVCDAGGTSTGCQAGTSTCFNG